MFTYLILYVLFYISVLTFILYFFKIQHYNDTIMQFPTSMVWQNMTLYSGGVWIVKWLFFLLSGLPPVFVFFLKFNFLLSALKYNGLLTQSLIFFNLLMSMFFYLQIFSNTTTLINKRFFKILSKKTLSGEGNVVSAISKYVFFRLIVAFLFLNFFGFIFFVDCSNIVNSFAV